MLLSAMPRMFEAQIVVCATLRAFPSAGRRMPMSSAMIEITTSSSMRVKPRWDFQFPISDFQLEERAFARRADGVGPCLSSNRQLEIGNWQSPRCAGNDDKGARVKDIGLLLALI